MTYFLSITAFNQVFSPFWLYLLLILHIYKRKMKRFYASLI